MQQDLDLYFVYLDASRYYTSRVQNFVNEQIIRDMPITLYTNIKFMNFMSKCDIKHVHSNQRTFSLCLKKLMPS